ncbi:MAG: DUF1266 domain-containing protein [Oscillospiraceae bacterium]|nr:DUF1266 domain-containing protein [Oscillospiraceae bacterium]MCL2248339.1 DUF1266 domain-containing protein [Oscillospiraceae bacterium]
MRKLYFTTVVLVLIGAMILLSACSLLDGVMRRSDNYGSTPESDNHGSTPEFDASFIIGDLEITLANDIGAWRLRTRYINLDGAYAFSVPISVTNVGEGGNGIEHSRIIAFSPDGWSTDIVRAGVNDETNIFSVGPIQPNMTKTGYIYVVYSGDGEYILEFTDNFGERVELRFDFELNHGLVQEIRTEFGLGETIDFNGLEITFVDDITWGRNIRFSSNIIEIYFHLPVILNNPTNRIAQFPWEFEIFSPEGDPIRNIGEVLMTERFDLALIRGVTPGESTSGYLHVRFVGDGEYRIVLRDADFPLGELWVVIPVHLTDDIIPFSSSFLAQHLTSPQMRSFELAHAVSPEQEWLLAFGAFVPTSNEESVRVFELDRSHSAAPHLLSTSWGVEDRESALNQLARLAEASGQSPLADDIFRTLILGEGVVSIPESEFWEGVRYGTLPEDYQEGLANVISNAQSRAAQDLLSRIEEFEGISEELFERVFVLQTGIELSERIERGLDAFEGAFELLTDVFGFTSEELLQLPTLAAWDYGRVAMFARYSVAAGFLEEEETWPFLYMAAERAIEIYGSWREFTAAHVLGRAIAFGNDSWGWIDVLDFLLNHPMSSFQTIDFFGP